MKVNLLRHFPRGIAFFSSLALVLPAAAVWVPGIDKSDRYELAHFERRMAVPFERYEFAAFRCQCGVECNCFELKSETDSGYVKKYPPKSGRLLLRPDYSVTDSNGFFAFDSWFKNTSKKDFKSLFLLEDIPPPFFRIDSQFSRPPLGRSK
jgi:hypothetical protein